MSRKARRDSPPLSAIPSEARTGSGFLKFDTMSGTEPGQHQGQVLPPEYLSALMTSLSITDRFRPAYISDGKECIIMYWVRHPDTGAWMRKREKLNHVQGAEARAQYARQRVRELNQKLALGWNPFVDLQAPRSSVSMEQALADFLTTKVREGLREDSLRSYRSLIHIIGQWMQAQGVLAMAVGAFTEENAITFMDDCFAARGISARTFNNYRTFYKTLGNWWVAHKYTRANVFNVVAWKRQERKGKNRRVFTDVERARIRTYLAEHHPRFLAFSLLVFHCALRPREAFHLKPHHVDLRRQCIQVEASFSKNRYDRVAAIPDVLMPELLALRLEEQRPDHYIFSDAFVPGGHRKDSKYSGKWWDRVRNALHLPPECKHYSLRDTSVLQLARDGVSRVDSQNHFDHHSSEMHDIYSRHQDAGGNEEVRRKMSAF